MRIETKRQLYEATFWVVALIMLLTRQAEVDRLKEEVKEQKELVQMILAEAYRNGVEIIVHENKEVQGE